MSSIPGCPHRTPVRPGPLAQANPAARGGAWTYRLDTLNLAHAAQVRAQVFLGEPTHRVDELAHLR